MPISPDSVKSASPSLSSPVRLFLPPSRSPQGHTLAGHHLQIQHIQKLRLRRGSFLGTSQPPIDRPGRSGVRGCPLSNPSKTLKANSALGPPRRRLSP